MGDNTHNSSFGRLRSRKQTQIRNELFHEISSQRSVLSKDLRERLKRLPQHIRKDLVEKTEEGYSPLFLACCTGSIEIVEFLITECDADIEQKGTFFCSQKRDDVWCDKSVGHIYTPLGCACAFQNVELVEFLIQHGSNVNALSDTGSTPLFIACSMMNIEIAQLLIDSGADVQKPNYKRETCLIASIASVELCIYLISQGSDVNAQDLYNRTALHYAILTNNLETTQLLLDHGADPFIKSYEGDDAIQTACLTGAQQIADYLMYRISYSRETLANAYELMGSTLIDLRFDRQTTVLYWQQALHIRLSGDNYISKKQIPTRPAYGNAVEFSTVAELDDISYDLDAIRIQGMLIYERILGMDHENTLVYFMNRGAFYHQAMQFQMCIDSWLQVLQSRIRKYSILHLNTRRTLRSIIRLMVILVCRSARAESSNMNIPRFNDVYGVFQLLASNLIEARQLLSIRPVYGVQRKKFDRTLQYLMHVIYLLLTTAKNADQRNLVENSVRDLLHKDIRCALTNETLLHLSVSKIQVMRNGNSNGNNTQGIFPNPNVTKLLLECGAPVDAYDNSKSTPLLVAALPRNYVKEVVQVLIEHGAHLDLPNLNGHRPTEILAENPANDISLSNKLSLKCLCSNAIVKFGITQRDTLPRTLVDFVRVHDHSSF
ncbi:protein fem-1 homolog C-like [Toxorhynchites rutilus septentrionalis]|uniref:protein fem-1 homolog C-like n=1 Tax=Toxorhynchites rutilus septentrionalis TaxID=329112 RepID=UPI00247A865C|nr:protein fem-1 homolog C-like [Toxorhynchites rutilus septentrionalis]